MSFIYNIKVKLRNWSDRSRIGNFLFQQARNIVANIMLLKSDESYAKWFYKLYTGKVLNLEKPKTFDEKVWWLKLNNRDPLLTRCSDKVLVREYVKECGLEKILIPEVAVYNKAKDIDFSVFKEEVIIKCNCGSGENCFYNPNQSNNKNAIISRMSSALKNEPYKYSREWNYKNIDKKIIAERVIRDKSGNLPMDYKFMCFDGEPKLLFLDIGLIDKNMIYNHKYPRNIYDMNFNLLPVKESRDNYNGDIARPMNFGEMIQIARTLSQPFPFCRVDLYNVDGKIYFGEITFYHGGGCNNISPEEWDYKIGSWIDLNSKKIKRI